MVAKRVNGFDVCRRGSPSINGKETSNMFDRIVIITKVSAFLQGLFQGLEQDPIFTRIALVLRMEPRDGADMWCQLCCRSLVS